MPSRLSKEPSLREFPSSQTKIFCFVGRSGEIPADFVQDGDLLLVKGSRGVKMERVVELLLARYAISGDSGVPGEGQPLDALLPSL